MIHEINSSRNTASLARPALAHSLLLFSICALVLFHYCAPVDVYV
jgi:hypothetical protein